jgi:cyanate permease
MPEAKHMSLLVVALVIAAAITGLAAIPGTPWSGFIHPGLLFFGIFAGVFLLGWLLDNAAQNALSGPPPKKAAHKRR